MKPDTAIQRTDDRREILGRQGLRLPPIILRQLGYSGIYCQPSISIEHQHLAKKYVLRGIESGGAIPDLGAYVSYVGAEGHCLSYLQRVDTIGVNGVHAIVIAPVLVRLQMVRVQRTYDLLITRHSLLSSDNGQRPTLESSILFFGRRGNLEMELWSKDAIFCGRVSPMFYTRGGELVSIPEHFVDATLHITAGACCVGCRHCHLLQPRGAATTGEVTRSENNLFVANEGAA